MDSLYGPAYTVPAEPSSLVMMLTGMAMLGIYMWRTGLLKERLQRTAKPKAATTPVIATSAPYEYCEYERRFTIAFSNLVSSGAGHEFSLTP